MLGRLLLLFALSVEGLEWLHNTGGLGAKSPYAFRQFRSPFNHDFAMPDASAELVYVASIVRHGTRMPTKRKGATVVQLAETVCRHLKCDDGQKSAQCHWCREVVDGPIQKLKPGALTEEGNREMQKYSRHLAKRIQQRTSRSIEIHTITSPSARTIKSCEAFAEAWPIPSPAQTCFIQNQTLLRPQEQCKIIQDLPDPIQIAEAANGEDWLDEISSLVLGALLSSDLLDATEIWPTIQQRRAMTMATYFACQTAVTVHVSGLTAQSSDHHHLLPCRAIAPFLNAFGRTEDCEAFVSRGMGHPLPRYIVSPLLRFLVDRIFWATTAASSSTSSPVLVDLLFSHDTVVLAVLAWFLTHQHDLHHHSNNDASKIASNSLSQLDGFASFCPFACRLSLEVYSDQTILLLLNDRPVMSLAGISTLTSLLRPALSLSNEEVASRCKDTSVEDIWSLALANISQSRAVVELQSGKSF